MQVSIPSATGRSSLRLPAFVSLLTTALAAGLDAQSVITPSHYENSEAPTFSSNYVAGTGPSRTLMILDELQGQARTVRGVAFRMEGHRFWRSYAPSLMVVSTSASTAVTTAKAPDLTFASNHGTDLVQTSSFQAIRLPEIDARTPAGEFSIRIPFTTPFRFGGAGPLCVQIDVTSRSNTSPYHLDYAFRSSTNPAIPYNWVGTGCKASGQSRPALLNPSGSANWPGQSLTLNYGASRLPANELVSLILGTRNDSVGGVPLPFTIPGSDSAPSGACNLYSDIFVAIPSLTNASGNLSTSVSFQVNPYFNGLDIYSQVIAPDQGANALDLVMTNGTHHNLVAPYVLPTVGTVAANRIQPTGTARGASQGYVVEIY